MGCWPTCNLVRTRLDSYLPAHPAFVKALNLAKPCLPCMALAGYLCCKSFSKANNGQIRLASAWDADWLCISQIVSDLCQIFQPSALGLRPSSSRSRERRIRFGPKLGALPQRARPGAPAPASVSRPDCVGTWRKGVGPIVPPPHTSAEKLAPKRLWQARCIN